MTTWGMEAKEGHFLLGAQLIGQLEGSENLFNQEMGIIVEAFDDIGRGEKGRLG